MYTADGHKIEAGMRVWTNNLTAGVVDLRRFDGRWFDVVLDGGTRVMQDAQRVAVFHPFTGMEA